MNTQEKTRSEFQSNKKQRAGQFFTAIPVQAKLKVSEPGDPFEREAEKVSQDIMSSNYESRGDNHNPVIQRKCESSEERDLDRKENPGEIPEVSEKLESHISKLDGKGRPLNKSEKSFYEPRFGKDFSNVRIHENDASAEKINAKAYTSKNHIVFNQGEYSGNSTSEKKLMAHELTHVVQQGGKGNKLNKQGLPDIQKQDEQSSGTTALSQEDRDWLYQRISFRMNLAYTKFVDACNTHQRHIRDLAAQNVDIASFVLDIALTFATPGIGRIISAGISRAVGQGASIAIYGVALGALDRVDQITSAATTVGKDLAKRGFQEVFSRSEVEQFVEDLKQIMSVSLDVINGNMQNNSDEELSVLFFNYDPSIATLNQYENQLAQMISDYRSQIIPIGRRTDERYGINRLRWIEGRSRRVLALTGEGRYAMAGGGIRFMTWITSSFKGEALRRSLPTTESQFPVIHYGNLESGSAPANLVGILDTPNVSLSNLVVEASTGLPSAQPSACPSCHGESSGRDTPSLLDRPFEFGRISDLQVPQENTEQLLEWIRQAND